MHAHAHTDTETLTHTHVQVRLADLAAEAKKKKTEKRTDWAIRQTLPGCEDGLKGETVRMDNETQRGGGWIEAITVLFHLYQKLAVAVKERG